MIEIVLGVVLFTAIVLALVGLILVARGRLVARCSSPTAASSSAIRCSATRPAWPFNASGSPTLRATVRWGSR